MARLFISYSRNDEIFARRLATSLSDMGADVWIDIEDIPAGMKWSRAIQEGLDSGELLIVIISPDSMDSRNVEDEWQYYLDNNKPVVPVLLRPTKIHFQLNRIQYIDFYEQDYATAIRQLHAQLKSKGVELAPPKETSAAASQMPDFDKMSTQEIERWMEELRKRQEQRSVEIPRVSPDTPAPESGRITQETPAAIPEAVPPAPSPPASRRRGWALWVGSAVVGAVVVLLAMMVLSNGQPGAQDAAQPTPQPSDTAANNDLDSDGDGLTDAEEESFGTDPNTPDMDNDGLTDKQEIDLGTDPTSNDSDGDGLFDGDEVASCTSPLSMDSDEDGTLDDVETAQGTECDENTDETVVAHNADWTPVIRTFDGVEMVLVPAGMFVMGTDPAELDALYEQCQLQLPSCRDNDLFADEIATNEIWFDQPFWIDRYEVSNGQAGVGDGKTDSLPRTDVTWDQAQMHCESRDARLPTEPEWEYASRGPDNLTYPFGDEFVGPNFNYCDASCELNWHDGIQDDSFAEAAPVGSFPESASWVGAEDMAGNVWEWTSTIYKVHAGDGYEDSGDIGSQRVLKGSSWNWLSHEARGAARSPHASNTPSGPWYGFRCARDFHDGDLS